MTRTMIGSKRLAKRDPDIGDQALPGIPDDITTDMIAPKLLWIDCQKLSFVSRGWQRVINSRQIYDARVRSQCTQAVVVLKHNKVHGKDEREFVLYSPSDGSYCKLPPIPRDRGQILWNYRCICLDSKLYLLGGRARGSTTSAEVYVLDLAGQRQWKQCASMRDRRAGFGCGALNGKVYVFGGVFDSEPVLNCEVYDPDTDAWSPIARMKAFRPKWFPAWEVVTALGEELLVIELWGESFQYEAYHPAKDQWRSVKTFTETCIGVQPVMFVMGGKLHHLTEHGINVYDICKNSWKRFQSFASADNPNQSPSIYPLTALVYKDELLAVALCRTGGMDTHLMRIDGLGCEDKEIEWQRTECSFSFNDLEIPFLSVVYL